MNTRREESFKEGMRKAVEHMEHEGEKSTTGRGTSVRARHVGEARGGVQQKQSWHDSIIMSSEFGVLTKE